MKRANLWNTFWNPTGFFWLFFKSSKRVGISNSQSKSQIKLPSTHLKRPLSCTYFWFNLLQISGQKSHVDISWINMSLCMHFWKIQLRSYSYGKWLRNWCIKCAQKFLKLHVMQQASVLTLTLVIWTCAQMAFLHTSLVKSTRLIWCCMIQEHKHALCCYGVTSLTVYATLCHQSVFSDHDHKDLG